MTRLLVRLLGKLPFTARGITFAHNIQFPAQRPQPHPEATNELAEYFASHSTGRGIWKFEHYFDIYKRHLSKFRESDVGILEIGVLAGGSLQMWRHWLGRRARIYGVDINSKCKAYADDAEIFIGDQGNRMFWQDFRRLVPHLDVVIDDGSHRPEDQIATFEELLPHLRPGGVYLCEDIHHEHNGFTAYLQGVTKALNAMNSTGPNQVQRWIKGVHVYPYVAVIEKANVPLERFEAPRRGTEWEPQ